MEYQAIGILSCLLMLVSIRLMFTEKENKLREKLLERTYEALADIRADRMRLIRERDRYKYICSIHIKEMRHKPPSGFTPAEIKNLIKLCHPDKHAGARNAEEITKNFYR